MGPPHVFVLANWLDVNTFVYSSIIAQSHVCRSYWGLNQKKGSTDSLFFWRIYTFDSNLRVLTAETYNSQHFALHLPFKFWNSSWARYLSFVSWIFDYQHTLAYYYLFGQFVYICVGFLYSWLYIVQCAYMISCVMVNNWFSCCSFIMMILSLITQRIWVD